MMVRTPARSCPEPQATFGNAPLFKYYVLVLTENVAGSDTPPPESQAVMGTTESELERGRLDEEPRNNMTRRVRRLFK